MVLKCRPVGFTSHGIAQYRTIYNHQMAPTLVDTGNNWQYSKLSLQLERRGSAVVSTSACYCLVFRAVRALRWRHLELPEFVPCVLNRWRHTHPILIIAYMPMLFYVKQLLTNRKIVRIAWMTKSNYIFLRTLARFNPQNWQLDSFLLVFWWWFAVVCGGLPAFHCFHYQSSQILVVICGGLRWFVPFCGGLWSFAVVCGSLGWFAVVCLIVIPVKTWLSTGLVVLSS